MKKAAVRAIAALAREAPSEVVARAYGGEGADVFDAVLALETHPEAKAWLLADPDGRVRATLPG